MNYNCVICGVELVVTKGYHKYCLSCRAEIENLCHGNRTFKEAVRVVCEKHANDREDAVARGLLERNRKSITDIVYMCNATGLSYGHQVAKLEGREH